MASDRLGRDGTELDPLGWEAFKSLLEKIELPALSSLSSLRERMSEVETFLCPPVWRCVETRARERLFDIFRGLETTQRTRALTARDVPGPLRVFEIISDSPGLETSWKSPFPRAWLQKTLKEMKAEAHKSFSHRRMLQDIESDDRIWKDWDKLDPGQQYHALAKLLTLKHRIKQVKEFNRQNKTSAAHPRPKRSYYPSVLTVDDLLGGPRRVHMHSQRDHAPMDRSTTSSQPLLSRAPMDQAQFEAKLVEAAPMERQVEQPTQRARGGGRHSRKQRFRTRNAAGTVSELAPTARSNAFSPRSSTPPRQPVPQSGMILRHAMVPTPLAALNP
ncbi:hypothetical protein JCM3766R1_003445 [Sporobolomyces carnicolor]